MFFLLYNDAALHTREEQYRNFLAPREISACDVNDATEFLLACFRLLLFRIVEYFSDVLNFFSDLTCLSIFHCFGFRLERRNIGRSEDRKFIAADVQRSRHSEQEVRDYSQEHFFLFVCSRYRFLRSRHSISAICAH